MNWIDLLIIFILVYNIIKGTSLGLIKSIFVLLQFLMSIYLSKMYYSVVSGYILNTPTLYKVFEKIISKEQMMIIMINVFSIIITYFFFRWLIGLLGLLISAIFKAPILKQLDKIGGLLIGIIRGMIILYIAFALLTPIGLIFPEGVITKGLENSLFSDVFTNHDLIIDFFKIKNYI